MNPVLFRQPSRRGVSNRLSIFLSLLYVSVFLGCTESNCAATELLSNRGFESGDSTGWSRNGESGILEGDHPHGGDWYGYVGNENNAIGSIHQFVDIPANATSAVLKFYLNIVTYETDAVPDDDKLDVNFRHGTTDALLKKWVTYTESDRGENRAGVYVEKRINMTASDLEAFRGQRVLLQFYGTTDWGDYTIFRIDDVSLDVETANSNLTPYTPQNWTAPLITARTATATTSVSEFQAGEEVFVNWAFQNDGAAQAPAFSVRLFLDGNTVQTWRADPLDPGYYTFADPSYSLGTLSEGTHEIIVIADVLGEAPETNEGDNRLVRQIQVNGAPRVTLSAWTQPSNGGRVEVSPEPGADGKYPSGTPVTLQPRSENGYRFLLWQGASSGTRTPLNLTLDSSMTITAVFERVNEHPTFHIIPRAEAATVTTTVPTVSAYRYIVEFTKDWVRWFLLHVFDGDGQEHTTIDEIDTSEPVRIIRSGTLPITETGLNLKFPLPGGKRWLLTTQIGDEGCTGSTPPLPSHTGINHYSLDLDNISRTEAGVTTVETDVPVLAAGPGVITFAGTSDLNGNYVVIDHDFDGNLGTGYQTRYLHLKDLPSVERTQTVVQGQRLGIMGQTGATAVHLHFGIRFEDSGAFTEERIRIALQRVRLEDLTLDEYVAECLNGIPQTYFPSTNYEP